MKQIARSVLAVLLTAGLLVGCTGRKTPGSDSGTTPPGTTDGTDNDLYADLPQGDFENQDFVILNNISDYAITTMVPDDLSSAVSSAIFSRNEYVKQELDINLKVKELPYAENKELMERLVISDLGGKTNTTSVTTNPGRRRFWHSAAFINRSMTMPLTSTSTSRGGTVRRWRSCRYTTTCSMWSGICS